MAAAGGGVGMLAVAVAAAACFRPLLCAFRFRRQLASGFVLLGLCISSLVMWRCFGVDAFSMCRHVGDDAQSTYTQKMRRGLVPAIMKNYHFVMTFFAVYINKQFQNIFLRYFYLK